MKCPCCSGKLYKECCKPYHEGKYPESALLLMRSRFSAYALSKIDYINETSTKKKNRHEILQFCKNTTFHNLEIIDFQDGSEKATVKFRAHLAQNGQDASFTELSHFIKVNAHWLYNP